MEIIVKRHDTNTERVIDVSLDSKLGETREVAQMLLGIPENLLCKLFLERDNRVLEDNLTFMEVDIRHNDRLILLLQEQEINSSQQVDLHSIVHSSLPKKAIFNQWHEPTEQILASVSSQETRYKLALNQVRPRFKNWHLAAIVSSIVGGALIVALVSIDFRIKEFNQVPFQILPQQYELSNVQTVQNQVDQASVLFFDKDGKKYTGQITKSEIRERQKLEESGVVANISWDDGVFSSILFMKDSRVRVWEQGIEYKGNWSWGTDNNSIYVRMDAGSEYYFRK